MSVQSVLRRGGRFVAAHNRRIMRKHKGLLRARNSVPVPVDVEGWAARDRALWAALIRDGYVMWNDKPFAALFGVRLA